MNKQITCMSALLFTVGCGRDLGYSDTDAPAPQYRPYETESGPHPTPPVTPTNGAPVTCRTPAPYCIECHTDNSGAP